ncbi:hypothetical protein [uncultured Tateyamaria sp.]|uniref:hypothetical protein n=1 Tax=uncultured Tateyamaria sp. TaxID=455651 RepID=UPI00260E9400|nr:hypothetical protein [uncultured Tateyamaria sp.]
MDFGSIIEDLGDLPDNPLEVWLIVAKRAVLVAKNANAGHTAGQKDVNNDLLLHFLDEMSMRLSVERPVWTGSSSYSNKWDTVQKLIQRQDNKLAVEKLGAKVGATGNGTAALPAPEQVEISNSGLVKIHSLLGDLRRAVDATDLPDKQKAKLHKHLTAFERELVTRSMSLGQAFGVLALVGAGLAGATSTLADGPQAWETLGRITAALGIEKEQQDKAQEIADQSKQTALLSYGNHPVDEPDHTE